MTRRTHSCPPPSVSPTFRTHTHTHTHAPMSAVAAGGWTLEEDAALRAAVAAAPPGADTPWSAVAARAGLARSGKSARLRWINQLAPGIRTDPWTVREREKSGGWGRGEGKTGGEIGSLVRRRARWRVFSAPPPPPQTHTPHPTPTLRPTKMPPCWPSAPAWATGGRLSRRRCPGAPTTRPRTGGGPTCATASRWGRCPRPRGRRPPGHGAGRGVETAHAAWRQHTRRRPRPCCRRARGAKRPRWRLPRRR